jgi:tetratricopeptide (TPR) repeat protein
MAYQQVNRMADAIKEFEKAEKLSPDSPAPIAALACAYAATGRATEARKDLARLEDMKQRPRYVPALYFLSIHLAFNDMKKVIDYGKQAIDERTDYLIYLGVEPRADSFRNSPELRELQTLIKR